MLARIACLSVALFALSGCAIHQTVKPAENLEGKLVCVLENPKVKGSFLATYKEVLETKGYEVRQLAPTASLLTCPVMSNYVANWRWDMAMYMEFAEIVVYSNGKLSGKATYDATRGSGNPGKFISAEKKVIELADQLFPTLAGH